MIEKHEKYKIVICDDDNTFAELLCEKIRAELYGKKEEILVEKYNSSQELLDHISVEDDLYFLDIDMPEINGMEVADRILTKNPHSDIIFISNHEEMVFESFRYMPLRFIRKEKMNQELKEALHAFLTKKEIESRVLEFSTREGMRWIAVDDIMFLESRRHYLQICCESENFELRGKISDYEKLLGKYGFGKYVKGKNNISFVWGIHSQYKYSGSGKYSKSVWNRTYEFCIFINSVYFDAGFS